MEHGRGRLNRLDLNRDNSISRVASTKTRPRTKTTAFARAVFNVRNQCMAGSALRIAVVPPEFDRFTRTHNLSRVMSSITSRRSDPSASYDRLAMGRESGGLVTRSERSGTSGLRVWMPMRQSAEPHGIRCRDSLRKPSEEPAGVRHESGIQKAGPPAARLPGQGGISMTA